MFVHSHLFGLAFALVGIHCDSVRVITRLRKVSSIIISVWREEWELVLQIPFFEFMGSFKESWAFSAPASVFARFAGNAPF